VVSVTALLSDGSIIEMSAVNAKQLDANAVNPT